MQRENPFGNDDFYRRMKALRLSHGYSCQELCNQLRLVSGEPYNRSTVRNWESRAVPTALSLVHLCKVYHCSVEYLLFGDVPQIEEYNNECDLNKMQGISPQSANLYKGKPVYLWDQEAQVGEWALINTQGDRLILASGKTISFVQRGRKKIFTKEGRAGLPLEVAQHADKVFVRCRFMDDQTCAAYTGWYKYNHKTRCFESETLGFAFHETRYGSHFVGLESPNELGEKRKYSKRKTSSQQS